LLLVKALVSKKGLSKLIWVGLLVYSNKGLEVVDQTGKAVKRLKTSILAKKLFLTSSDKFAM
jgi:hypothetical protein